MSTVKSDNVRGSPDAPSTTITPDPWYRGYATALAEIWRLHGHGQLVRHILQYGGLTLKDLELGGVEEYDLAAIREACMSTRSEAQIRDGDPITGCFGIEPRNSLPLK